MKQYGSCKVYSVNMLVKCQESCVCEHEQMYANKHMTTQCENKCACFIKSCIVRKQLSYTQCLTYSLKIVIHSSVLK